MLLINKKSLWKTVIVFFFIIVLNQEFDDDGNSVVSGMSGVSGISSLTGLTSMSSTMSVMSSRSNRTVNWDKGTEFSAKLKSENKQRKKTKSYSFIIVEKK